MDDFPYGVDGFHHGAGFYIGTVHFERWGWRSKPAGVQWRASASIGSLAEDLGLAQVTRYRDAHFIVDDFGNLRFDGQRSYRQEQWRYSEEWEEHDAEEEASA